MASIKWSEREPRNTDRVARLSEQWPSTKTAITTAVEEVAYFTDSLVSAGDSRLTTGGRGATSFYYGARSAVSDPGRIGSAMLVSDESRLIVFDASASSELAASSQMITHYQDLGGPNFDQVRSIEDSSQRVWFTANVAVSAGDNNVVWPLAFRGTAETPPDVFVTPAGDADSACSYRAVATAINASGMTVNVTYLGPGADPNSGEIYYLSHGTLPL